MGKINSYKKIVFAILVLLSISSLWNVMARNEISDLKKIIVVSLNLIFIYLISEYIETYIYHKIVKSMFGAINYTQNAIYKIHFSVLPICSLLIYIAAWLLFIENSVVDIQTLGILIIMASALIIFTVQVRDKVIFANEEYIFLHNEVMSISSIQKYTSSKKKILGFEVMEIKIATNLGNEYILRVDRNQTNQFCTKLLKKSSA